MRKLLFLLCFLTSSLWAQDRTIDQRTVGPNLTRIAPTFDLGWGLTTFPVSVANVASDRNVLSPGADVVVKGRGLSDVIQSARGVYGFELAGCSVTIGKEPALIRGVDHDAIYAIAPDYYRDIPLMVNESGLIRFMESDPQWIFLDGIVFRGRWQDVTVTTPKGVWRTKVAVADVSPGLYQKDGVASGLTRLGQGPVTVVAEGVKPGSRISLLATGFRHAQKVKVYFADTSLSVEAEVHPWGKLFPWLESVAFDLPVGLSGEVRLIVQADGVWSNTVGFTVRE